MTYAPSILNEVIELNPIKKALTNFDFRLPVMFEGEKGCGKTMLADILAKQYGAEDRYIEVIDCGQYSGVDAARTISDEFIRPSIFLEKKSVLILDEIHRLSDAAQNAWLIPLDPKKPLPKNKYVIACTTTTSKMSGALLRRFIRFKVSSISRAGCLELINRICKEEKLDLPKKIRFLLVEYAKGIPGLIITSLPKVKNIDDENEARSLLELLAIQADENVFELFKMMISPHTTWSNVKISLDKALKIRDAEFIKAELMNLIGSRILSKYPSEEECKFLALSFEVLLKTSSFLEKASLIVALFQISQLKKGQNL